MYCMYGCVGHLCRAASLSTYFLRTYIHSYVRTGSMSQKVYITRYYIARLYNCHTYIHTYIHTYTVLECIHTYILCLIISTYILFTAGFALEELLLAASCVGSGARSGIKPAQPSCATLYLLCSSWEPWHDSHLRCFWRRATWPTAVWTLTRGAAYYKVGSDKTALGSITGATGHLQIFAQPYLSNAPCMYIYTHWVHTKNIKTFKC